jgi:uncharacterized protein (TIGR02246 family)
MFATATAVAFISWFAPSPAAAVDEPLAIANQLVQKWVDAYNRRDAAALDSLYASNAILMPMGKAQPIKGEPDIRKFIDEAVKRPALDDLKITRSELILVGPRTAVEAGTWSADAPAQNGAEVVHMMGTYLTVSTQEHDGQWKVIANTWNTMPLPTAQQATAATPQAGPGTDASGTLTSPQAGTSTPK